jgi:hypothetical protein
MKLLNVSSILRNPAFRIDFTFFSRVNTLDENTGLFSFVDGAKIPAFGSIQPVEREEIHTLMKTIRGGEAIRDAIIIFTASPLVVGVIGNPSQSGSFVQHDGKDWLVVEMESYKQHGHVEAIAVLTDEVVVYSPAVEE